MRALLRRFLPSWLMLIALIAVSCLLGLTVSGNVGLVLAMLIGCAGAGAVLRDFGYARGTRMVWPMLTEIIDWRKVDELLEEG